MANKTNSTVSMEVPCLMMLSGLLKNFYLILLFIYLFPLSFYATGLLHKYYGFLIMQIRECLICL